MEASASLQEARELDPRARGVGLLAMAIGAAATPVGLLATTAHTVIRSFAATPQLDVYQAAALEDALEGEKMA